MMEQQSVIDEQDMIEARFRAHEITTKHIARVQELLKLATDELTVRGIHHDKSKYNEEELEPLAKMQFLIDREGQAPYQSDEYKRRTAMLGPMLKHHYANNSHHPEHYSNGIAGMDLFDLVEMFLDWKAASERGEESAMNITAACDRFGVSQQLTDILHNTANKMGFKNE